jgi:hypothetical protein
LKQAAAAAKKEFPDKIFRRFSGKGCHRQQRKDQAESSILQLKYVGARMPPFSHPAERHLKTFTRLSGR